MSRPRHYAKQAEAKRQVPRLEHEDDDDDKTVCERCNGDGMDKWCDYLLPCPECQGGQRP